MKKTRILLPLLCFILNVSAQTETKIPTYKTYFEEGSFLMVENDPVGALRNFEIAYRMDSSSANINYMLGICYLQSSTKKAKAEYHLARAVKDISNSYKADMASEKAAPPLAYFFYGQALHLNYKFDEALKQFAEFSRYVDPKDKEYVKMLEKEVATSSLAKTMVANPINVMITNMGDSINSPYPEYSPVLNADENTLIFTTRRPSSTGGQKTPEGLYFEDIVVSHKDENGIWSKPVSLSENVNSMGHEASINLSPDGQILIVFKDNNGNGDIYYTSFDGTQWSILNEFGSNVNTEFWESHACLNADGTVLFFASDRPGGYGGKDIYRCVKLPNGQWSKALNMGENINSEYDEDGAFIHPDGQTFFYSTNGYKTMGGYDIMYATLNEDNKFSNATNIGYPVNTTDDDIFYVTSPDGKRGYFSSAKKDGFGENDIYRITIAEPREKFLALFKGRLIPAEGESLPDHLVIVVRDKESNEIVGTYRPRLENGSFSTILPPGKEYNFSYRTESGEEFYNEDVSVNRNQSYQEIKREVNLEPVKLVGKVKVKHQDIVLNMKVMNSKKHPRAIGKAKITLVCDSCTPQVLEADSLGNSNGLVLEADKNYTVYAETSYKRSAPIVISTAGMSTARMMNQPLYLYGKSEKYSAVEYRLNLLVKNTKNNLPVADAEVALTSSGGKTLLLRTDAAGMLNDVPLSSETKYTFMASKFGYASDKESFTTGPIEEAASINKEIALTIEQDSGALANCQLPDTEYEVYFKYNRNKKESSDPCWENFTKKLSQLSRSGKVTVLVYGSASKVPTRKFGNNEKLAQVRASRLRKDIVEAVRLLGGDPTKLQFSLSSSVGGPEYMGDWNIGRKKYEAHQFSKAKVK
ncbi:MAG: PD40 domain-containing protein [Bacteroidia bacterium]|nr:PD40 domain-containing protein [Bacteroidia bacterium]